MQSSKAIPFILKNFNNDTYHLTPEAQHFLMSLQTPLSVVTVAGLYRTGKSYLLNRVILNRNSGFGVGPTVNPCTKGLWIWAQPIPISQGRTLLVVDTQGLGALDEESNHDMKIFCLAVLLSSNFIYNSVGSIDEPALQTLSLVLNLVSGIDKDNYSNRPNFLWVVRDFALQLINEKGQQITSNEYLKHALSIDNLKQPQKIQLRKTISQAFSERQCFTLVKPLIDQIKLQNLDKISPDQLRPEFISQTIALRKYILQSLKEVKINNNSSLRGSDYIIMIKKYLEAINNGAVPDMMDTWGFIKQEKAHQAANTVKQNYVEKLKSKLNNKLPLPTAKLTQILTILRHQAHEQFLKLSYEQNISNQLKEYFTVHETQMNRLNSKQAKNILGQILKRQFEPYQKKLLSEYYTDAGSYENDIRNTFCKTIQDKFNEKIDISISQINLFAERRISQGIKFFERRVRDELNKIRQMRMEAQSGLQNQIKMISKSSQEQKRRFQEELFALEKRNIMLNNQKQRLEEQMEKERREQGLQTGRFRRKLQQNQNQIDAMQRQILRLQNMNSQHQKQSFILKKDLQKQKALSSQKIQHLSTKLTEHQKRSQYLQHEIDRVMKNWQNEKRGIINDADVKIEKLIRQRKQLSDSMGQLINQHEHQRFINEKLKQDIEILKLRHNDQIIQYREKYTSSNKKQRKEDNEELIRQLNLTKQRWIKAQEDVKQSEGRAKIANDQLKMMKSNNDKQEAIFSQKIEFQSLENHELKTKNAELNAAYQRLLQSSQYNNTDIEINFKKKIQQLQNEHIRHLRDLQEETEKKITAAKRQLTYSIRQKQEVEMQLTLQRKRGEQREKQLNITLHSLQKAYEDLNNKYTNTEQGYAEVTRQKESYYSHRVRQLQSEIQNIKERASNQIQENSRKSQEEVEMIKNYSEIQRSRLQKRLEEQKEKSMRKEREYCEEWTKKLSQQKENYQNIIGELQQKLNHISTQFSQQLNGMRCDYDIKLQKMTNASLEERMELGKKNALLQQEIQIIRRNLISQMEERSKNFQSALESQRKDLLFECEQQIKAAKEAMQEIENRYQGLKKTNRKCEQSNLLLKSQLDKEKSLFKEKEQTYGRRMKEMEERCSEQIRIHTKEIQSLKNNHSSETIRLNQEIEKYREKLSRSEDEKAMKESNYQQQKNTLITKHNYLQSKLKRAKDDHQDLLKKFQATVISLSSQNHQQNMQREMQQSHKRMRQQYNRKISEKQQSINQQKKESQQKIMRLQTQNKSLRDKLLIFEMRQSNTPNRYQNLQPMEKDKYERAIHDLKQQLQRERTNNRRLKDERDQFQTSIRMERSRVSDRSERHSFISEITAQSGQKGLIENRSLLNRKPPTGTSVKKQDKRFTNVQEGLMRWNQNN